MSPCPGRATGRGHSGAELLLLCHCVTRTCGAALHSGQGSGSTSWENNVPCASSSAPDTGIPFTESQDGWKAAQWVSLSHLPAGAHGTGLCPDSSGIFPVSVDVVPKSEEGVASGLLQCLRRRYSVFCSVKTPMLRISNTKSYLGHNNLRSFKIDKKEITLLLYPCWDITPHTE